ncbi:MAG: methionyl-tRNA formyltransferase, partial [Pseudomonadota bacterium]|nr:methionyl-tRNA formyltransferase [Pseudomonadota bacterium]
EGLKRAMTGDLPVATPQPEQGATYAKKLEKVEAKLDFSRPAIELERQVRAFNPWPVAEGIIVGESLRIWAASAIEIDHHAAPATLLGVSGEGIDLACGVGALRITAMQRPGGKRIEARDYLNARPELRAAR